MTGYQYLLFVDSTKLIGLCKVGLTQKKKILDCLQNILMLGPNLASKSSVYLP